MSRRLVILLLGVVAIADVGVTYGRGLFVISATPQPVAVDPPSPLVVPSDKLNFGRTWETNHFAWSFPVTNRGAEPLTIDGISSSCSRLSVSPQHFDIKPGETITVTAVVDLTAKARPTDAAAFLLTPNVKWPSKSPQPKVEWLLTGTSRRLLTLDRRPTFGRVSVLDQPLKPVSIQAISAIPLSLGLAAKSDSATIHARAIHTPGDLTKYRVELTASKPLPLGPVTGTFTLTPADRTEKNLPVVTVPFDGLIVPDVECLPPSVLGGGYRVGESFTQSVSLASLGNRPFKVLSATADGPGLSVKQDGSEYLVTQKCEQPGQQTGKVVFQVEAADGRYAITAEVSYVGVQD
jgi:hypothetical protein